MNFIFDLFWKHFKDKIMKVETGHQSFLFAAEKIIKQALYLDSQDCNNQTVIFQQIFWSMYFCNYKSDSKSFFKKLWTLCVASEAYNRNIQFDHPDDMLNRPLSQRGETVYEEAFLF